MNSCLLLFIFLSFNMVSSNKTLGTVGKMQLMSATMLRNINSNQKVIMKNAVIISEQLTRISQVLTHKVYLVIR